MILGERVLALITARGGSKGLPGKNVRPLAGAPLISWTVSAAHGATLVDRTILSTDDQEIAEAARQCGCDVPFMRSPGLATDDAPSLDVVFDALDRTPGYGVIVLLQPTSPLRTAQDIDNALRQCADAGAPACVSVCAASESPYWMFELGEEGRLKPLLRDRVAGARRQDLPPVYVLNGAIYVARAAALRQARSFLMEGAVAYEMPRARSVDIDDASDLLIAESYLNGTLR